MFDTHFETILADDDTSRRIHYQLRYQVYCKETEFEDPAHFPDRQEQDEWDAHATHFLVREKATGQWIAAMRLILPECNMLPIETLCNINPAIISHIPRSRIGEVSRLCMSASYRRRSCEMVDPSEFADAAFSRGRELLRTERRKEPEILLGLLRAVASYSQEHDIRYWYFLITPALARMVGRLSIELQRAGPICQHRGERHPFLADLEVEKRRVIGSTPRIEAMFRRSPAYRRFTELPVVSGIPRGMAMRAGAIGSVGQ